jgi:hypothetical protein
MMSQSVQLAKALSASFQRLVFTTHQEPEKVTEALGTPWEHNIFQSALFTMLKSAEGIQVLRAHAQ